MRRSPTLEQSRDQMRHLQKIFDSYQNSSDRTPGKLRLGTRTIRRLVYGLPRIVSDDKHAVVQLQMQGHELIKHVERELKGFGLVRVDCGLRWEAREDTGRKRSKLTAVDEGVAVERTTGLRRSKRIAANENRTDKTKETGMDEEKEVTRILGSVTSEGQDESRKSNRVTENESRIVEHHQQNILNMDVSIFNDDDDDYTVPFGVEMTAQGENDRAENEVMDQKESHKDDDEYSRMVGSQNKAAEDNRVELGMRLKDELLWYDHRKDFDEDLLP